MVGVLVAISLYMLHSLAIMYMRGSSSLIYRLSLDHDFFGGFRGVWFIKFIFQLVWRILLERVGCGQTVGYPC